MHNNKSTKNTNGDKQTHKYTITQQLANKNTQPLQHIPPHITTQLNTQNKTIKPIKSIKENKSRQIQTKDGKNVIKHIKKDKSVQKTQLQAKKHHVNMH